MAYYRVWFDTAPRHYETVEADCLRTVHKQHRDEPRYHHTEPEAMPDRAVWARIRRKVHGRMGARANYNTGV